MAEQQKFTVELPEGLSRDERLAIADAIIEHIVDRTQRGVDRNGKRFPGYSKSYMDSVDFTISGKSKNVDLQLSGDMLAAIALLKDRRGELEIGFRKSDKDENARAEGNILGSYGREPNPKKARDFLGLTQTELKRILREFEID
jgi:hypothetical protein